MGEPFFKGEKFAAYRRQPFAGQATRGAGGVGREGCGLAEGTGGFVVNRLRQGLAGSADENRRTEDRSQRRRRGNSRDQMRPGQRDGEREHQQPQQAPDFHHV
jgi:hypothetical protein